MNKKMGRPRKIADEAEEVVCLMGQVREVYPNAWMRHLGGKWYVFTSADGEWAVVATGKTEAEALQAALEAWQ